jgi:hypothetical protein
LVCWAAQVDVTDQGNDSGEGSALGAATPGGLREAGRVGRALRHMGYEGAGEEGELWAGFDGRVAPIKPHKASDPAWAALRAVVEVRWVGEGACLLGSGFAVCGCCRVEDRQSEWRLCIKQPDLDGGSYLAGMRGSSGSSSAAGAA